MDPRELLARLNIPQSLSLESIYNTSLPVLGISALVCTIITYSIAKMFGFGSRNEFIVEGQVCTKSCI
jgi:3-dehydrosphinganine reductase